MPPWIFPEPRRRAGARWVGAERGREAPPPPPRTISFQFKTLKSLVCELGFFFPLSLSLSPFLKSNLQSRGIVLHVAN